MTDSSPPRPRVGSEIGGYEVEASLARGAGRETLRATDPASGRPVALKLLAREQGADEGIVARAERVNRQLGDAPDESIVRVLEVLSEPDRLVIVREWEDADDLVSLLRVEERLNPALAIDLVSQLAQGLDAARWRLGVVHGDLKPANILVGGRGDPRGTARARLVDFGFWTLAGRSSLLAQAESGRPVGYVSPEQVAGEEPSSRSDQYALACVLYECLTGRPPFTGDASAVLDAHVGEDAAPVRSHRPELAVVVDHAIARALAKRPEDRYGTCCEFVAALSAAPAPEEPAAASVALAPLTPPTPESREDEPGRPSGEPELFPPTRLDEEDQAGPPASRTRSRRLALAGIAALAVVIAIVLSMALLSNDSDPATGSIEGLAGEVEPLAGSAQEGGAPTGAPAPRWSRAAIDASPGNTEMRSVARGPGGLVAVGVESSGSRRIGAVWTSVDGLSWSRVGANDPVFGVRESGGVQINSVTAGGPGFVAVGSDGGPEEVYTGLVSAVVWTSIDGVNWSRAPDGGSAFGRTGTEEMRSVTTGGPGLVAVGVEDTGSELRSVVWTSVDGLSWARVPDEGSVFGGGSLQLMSDVTSGGPGLVAVGTDISGSRRVAAVWTSEDGITWDRVSDENSALAGEGEQSMASVTAGGQGLVAVGANGSGAAVWTSADGVDWSRVSRDIGVFGGLGQRSMTGVTVGGPGLVAVGVDGADAAVWTSVDGLAWSREAGEEVLAGAGMRSVTDGGPGLVAVGADGSDAVAWTSGDAQARAASEAAGGNSDQVPLTRGSIVRIDPQASQPVAAIAPNGDGGADQESLVLRVTAGGDSVWSIGLGEIQRVAMQIDPNTNTVKREIEIVGEATDVAIGGGSVWVTSLVAGDGVLVELAADTGRFRRAISLGYSGVSAVAFGEGSVWVTAAGSEGNVALRIDPASGEFEAVIPLSNRPNDIAVGNGTVWVVGGRTETLQERPGTAWHIDPSRDAVVATVELPGGASVPQVAIGAGAVWVTDAEEGVVFRIDPSTNRLAESISVPDGPIGIDVGNGSLWLAHHPRGLVSRIDPETSQVVETFNIEGACGCSIAVGAGSVWAS